MDFFAELAGRWNAEPRNRATVIAATFAHALAHVGRRPEVTGEQLRHSMKSNTQSPRISRP
ncbi:MAG: hypothetical protein DI536_01760 [Archangium gephyra]|uniref:Uncharacterized protein n=1 Tax=Archangium gephyra TaxID=48 RepID=A0A2W5W613_9BACT|nr:MAG: hypothetical protein DI536_01760 [Archangium gephyra]